jgi:hypothetical protein
MHAIKLEIPLHKPIAIATKTRTDRSLLFMIPTRPTAKTVTDMPAITIVRV